MASAGKILRATAYWLGWYALYVLATIAAGALLGAVLSPLVNPVFQKNLDAGGALLLGVRLGAQWGGVWAGGMGLVLCFRRAYLQRHPNAATP